MGLFNWFSKERKSEAAVVEERFAGLDGGRWPADIPLTHENLLLAAKYHHVYAENFNLPVIEDGDQEDWRPIEDGLGLGRPEEIREKVRRLVFHQPNCRRALMLYCYYIAGNDFTASLRPLDEEAELTEEVKAVIRKGDLLWREFLDANVPGFSFEEWVKRTYRDGEMPLQLHERNADNGRWPPRVRFIDPERIRDKDLNEDGGIITKPDDVSTVEKFLITDEGKAPKAIPASQIIFIKLDTDSTEVRGCSRFAGVMATAQMLRGMVRNEVIHRNLQASIVLVRKVAGGRAPALGIVDHASTGSSDYSEGPMSREKIRPGTILTVTKGVEVEFAQPSSGFSDASPLIALLIRQISATTGWTYEQISADTGQGNLASSLVQESPTLQMVLAERRFHTPYIRRLHRWVIDKAIAAGRFPEAPKGIWEEYDSDIRFGDPVTKDPLKAAQANNLYLLNQTISRAEARRRAGVSNEQMARELKAEKETELYVMAIANQLPDGQDMADSSQSNATDGSGTNQGDAGSPPGHKDNQNAKGNQ